LFAQRKGTLLTRPAAYLRVLSLPVARQLASIEHASLVSCMEVRCSTRQRGTSGGLSSSVLVHTLSLRKSASECGNPVIEIATLCRAKFAMTGINKKAMNRTGDEIIFDSGPGQR
jgi:hypothetical protein